jgi:hypothetical protein
MRTTVPRLILPLGFACFVTACNERGSEQAKRYREGQKAIALFEQHQADEQPSNWSEPRLLAALTSPDPSNRANSARELGLRRSENAREALRELMQNDTNSIIVAESELALIRIGHPEDIGAIRDYASPRVETLDHQFLRNLSLIDDPWVEELLNEAWRRSTDNSRRWDIVDTQSVRRERMGKALPHR